MLDYTRLRDFFIEYIRHYRELFNFEVNKLRLITEDNVEELGKSLAKEQAFMMKTTALENKRIAFLGAEYQTKTFQELIALAPNELRGELTAEYHELSKLVMGIKKMNDSAHGLVENRVAAFERIQNGNTDTYSQKGVKKNMPNEVNTLNKDV